MELPLFITFVFASIALIVMPGPNVLVVVSTSISHGAKKGLQTVLGTSSAMVLQLTFTALSTSWLVATLVSGLFWLKWLGVAYLIYLGVTHLYRFFKNNTETSTPRFLGTYSRGFFVSLTNPKTLLFFGAFLPQFVSPDGDYLQQIAILSLTFLLLASIIDVLYALLAARVSVYLQSIKYRRLQSGLSGLIYFGSASLLSSVALEKQ